MSKGNTTETDVLLSIFNATAFSWNANTDLYLALHTGDPGEAGNQSTSEATYTSYARVTVSRNAGGFTVSGNGGRSARALRELRECCVACAVT